MTDLKSKIIRCPMDPIVTLKDDFFRILRAAKYAVRLSFAIDPSIVATAKDPKFRQEFSNTVKEKKDSNKKMTIKSYSMTCLSLHGFCFF